MLPERLLCEGTLLVVLFLEVRADVMAVASRDLVARDIRQGEGLLLDVLAVDLVLVDVVDAVPDCLDLVREVVEEDCLVLQLQL